MRIKLNFPLTLEKISNIINGEIKANKNENIYYLSTDSREVQKGDLFIALKGKHFSADDFCAEVQSKGGFILSENYAYADITAKNTENALLILASYYRKQLHNLIMTIGITGSVGKTTTKEMLSNFLSYKYKTHSTKENQNNALGVAYTLLSAPEDTEVLIVEMGMNHRGEISKLSRAVTPDFAIITNIGNAHIGNLGSREAIAKAKLEIADGMSKKRLIVPANEPLIKTENTFLTVGNEDSNADIYYKNLKCDASSSKFDLITPTYKSEGIRIEIPGKHIVENLMSIIAIANILNFETHEIHSGISKFTSAILRQKLLKIGDFKIYDDTYSSSPEATVAILDMMSLSSTLKVSCVLGDMKELGENGAQLHYKVGYEVGKRCFSKLYTFGEYSKQIKNGAIDSGMPIDNIFTNEDINSPETTAKQILENSKEGETIIFKASHSVSIDRVYLKLKELVEKTNA